VYCTVRVFALATFTHKHDKLDSIQKI
jgi:hypothetical protein